MEKNRIRPVKVGNGVRMSYAHQGEVLEMPNLIEVQTNSYQWFLPNWWPSPRSSSKRDKS